MAESNYIIKAPIKVDINVYDQEYTEITTWSNSGEAYDCSTLLPLTSTVEYKESFIQTKTCSQDQTATKTTYQRSSKTGEQIVLKSEEISQTLSIDISEEALGTYKSRMLCADILAWGESSGNKVYTVDVDGDGSAYSSRSAYCDMTGGGWTLYDNFGTKLAKINAATIAYNASAINSLTGLEGAGYTHHLTSINNSYYEVWQGYMQFYYSGVENGYIRKVIPSWAKGIRVGSSNQWYGGTNVISLGSQVDTISSGQSHTYSEFTGSGNINIKESGIVWMDSVWVK